MADRDWAEEEAKRVVVGIYGCWFEGDPKIAAIASALRTAEERGATRENEAIAKMHDSWAKNNEEERARYIERGAYQVAANMNDRVGVHMTSAKRVRARWSKATPEGT